MADANAPKFVSQAEFARLQKVSRKSVTEWKNKGLLVLSDTGQVDVEASEWNLDQRPATNRGGVTHRPVRASGNKSAGNSEPPANPKSKPAPKPPRPAELDDDSEPDFDPDNPNLSTADAMKRKENYLGLLRKRELEVLNGEWIRVEEVGAQVEHEYATVRERMLAIPGKIAALLVGQQRPAIEARILREVTEALNELHDPVGIAERLAARGPADDGEAGA